MNLKAKFENIITRVENLNEDVVFQMSSFTQCVFGQLNEKPHKEFNCIKRNLGCIPLYFNDFPLCHNAQTRFDAPVWSNEDWEVVRLFTAAIGFGYITRDEWLKLAKEQLDKMA